MTLFHILASLLAAAALASYVNHRFLGLPTTIGLMLISLVLSLVLVALGHLGVIALNDAMEVMQSVNFGDLLLHGMLAFLLFAGALHVDLEDLKSEAVPVALLSTVGVAITAFVTGTLFWGAARVLGLDIPYLYALLFGALVAPTDPIAVLGIMKGVAAPKSLQMRVTGESLFNDGIGVVVFLTLLGMVESGGEVGIGQAGLLLVTEVLGGAALGFGAGWVVYRLLSSVDDYPVEILLTLGLAAGVYAAAEAAHVSAPIAVVVAGLLIGNHGRAWGMSDKTREHLDTFWELIDEVLNALLFVLIGLEVLVIHLERLGPAAAVLAALAVPAALLARLIGVGVPITLLRLRAGFAPGSVPLLAWAGIRGGISIALALSLPETPQRELILAATYVVVVFSVLVQGLTLGRLLSGRDNRLESPSR